MRKIGEIISELRINKGLSQAELAAGILSKAQLSKAENNLTTLSADKFIALLNKMNVDLAEFSKMLEEDEHSHWISLLKDITSSVVNNNVQQAKLVEQRALDYYTEQPTTTNRLQLIMVSMMILQINNNPDYLLPQKSDINYLTDYLFTVDEWTNFELLLYGNTMSVLPLEMVNQISRELIAHTDQAHQTFEDFQLVFALLYTTVILNLKNDNLKNANKIVHIMKSAKVDEQMLSIRFYIHLAAALTNYYDDSTQVNKDRVLAVLNTLRILGSDKIYLTFLDQINNFISETKN